MTSVTLYTSWSFWISASEPPASFAVLSRTSHLTRIPSVVRYPPSWRAFPSFSIPNVWLSTVTVFTGASAGAISSTGASVAEVVSALVVVTAVVAASIPEATLSAAEEVLSEDVPLDWQPARSTQHITAAVIFLILLFILFPFFL